MWGYRLVRDADWAAMLAELADMRTRERALMTGRAIDAGDAAAAKTRADFMTVRNHVLESNLATLEQKWLGVPRTLATVHETPTNTNPMAEGLLSLEDVGDAQAAELKAKGMLHDDGDDLELPSGAALTPAPQFDHDEG